MANESGPKPTKAFYIAIAVVVLGLGGFALYRAGILAPKGKTDGGDVKLTPEEMAKLGKKPDGTPSSAPASGPEKPDDVVLTKPGEYKFVPEERLPALPAGSVAGYKMAGGNTIKMALNVWAGWAPVVYANGGFKPNKEWSTASGKKFKLELVLVDDPVAMRNAYVSGDVQIGWATVDMIPLFMDELKKDARTMPRVFHQVDWSNGGDGIVGRGIQNIGELKGKKVVLAQNSPSQYFVLNALINAGIQPSDVKFSYTGDAFQAASAFNGDKTFAGVVSWAPDIYKLSEVKGNKLIVSTLDANRLIADVWFARADFAKDNPDMIEALVRGFLDATEAISSDEAKKKDAARYMAEGYGMKQDEVLGMLGDAHWTNFAENKDFLTNPNNPTNFERTWDMAYFLYTKVGKITGEKVTWDQVVDFSVIAKLAKEEKYASSTNNYITDFAPKSVTAIKAESGEILTKTVMIRFFPNSFNVFHKVSRDVNGKTVEELYDPTVVAVVEEIGKLTGQYGAARIVIEGHTDSSMKGTIPYEAVQELSQQRADSVRSEILKKFPSISPNQISVVGYGWNHPADAKDAMNQSKNRRVEVKVYPLEAK
jgi:NitT/TauT family transport system substrate-binding protein